MEMVPPAGVLSACLTVMEVAVGWLTRGGGILSRLQLSSASPHPFPLHVANSHIFNMTRVNTSVSSYHTFTFFS